MGHGGAGQSPGTKVWLCQVVYNTGGYETVEAVKALAGYVDIWLADYKYADSALAAELSAARDYPAVADAALRQMLVQTGVPVYDADGYLRKGVIVRHLALPGHVEDSKAVLRRLAALREETGVAFVPSLMSQFTPFYKAAEHGLGRRITTYEYRQVIDEAVQLGLTDGYMQEKEQCPRGVHPAVRFGGRMMLLSFCVSAALSGGGAFAGAAGRTGRGGGCAVPAGVRVWRFPAGSLARGVFSRWALPCPPSFWQRLLLGPSVLFCCAAARGCAVCPRF